jgi:LCP family protein required for cell wall assembly
VLRSVSLALVAVMSFGATGFATGYVRLQNNVETHDIENLLGTRPQPVEHVDPTDPNAGQAMNILLIGSDSRDGENAALGGENDGMRSDTTILAHISADRTRMELVSIPRDSRVDIPSCNFEDGSSSRPQSARFNAAFSIGADHNDDIGEAAACTVHTVEELTGVLINEWAVVDFAGFQNMIDALGGVQMCFPEELYSEEAQLHLLPGSQVINGTQALALARARKGMNLGDGSDLMRLGRQQQLLGAIAQGAMSKNMLTDAPALYRFMTAASQSLTTSPNLGDLQKIVGLAFSLKDMPSSNLVFMTIPYTANPDDRNEVVWTSEADQVWSNIKQDVPIVTPAASTTPATPGAGTTPAAPTTPTTVPTPGVDPITADDVVTVCG